MPALAAAGQTISFADINTALGRSPTAPISLDDTELRTTAQNITSGTPIDIYSHIAGKSRHNLIIASDTIGYDLKTQCVADGYVAGKSYITLTINSGVYVGGNSAGTTLYATDNWALNIAGFTTGDKIVITNNGYIIGRGGAGGSSQSYPGGLGGNAVRIGFAGVHFAKAGSIQGGGGGGAGGANAAISLGSKFNRYTGYGTGGNGGGGAGYPGGAGRASSVVSSTSQGLTTTLPASEDGIRTAGGIGGAYAGYLTGFVSNGANGGGPGVAGGNTYIPTTWTYTNYAGYPNTGYYGYGGNAGWAIFYDNMAIRDSTTTVNLGFINVGSQGYGGVYG